MKDENLYKICLAFSAVSILALLGISHFTEPELVKISSIDENYIEQTVRLKGQIEDLHVTQDGHFLFHVKDGTGRIQAAVFKEDADEMGLDSEILRNAGEVEMEGKIQEYNGTLEILPNEITI